MNTSELNKAFKEASERAIKTTIELPPDIMLLLYAYYKQGTQENHIVPFEDLDANDLRGAFKYNALIQVKGITPKEAKKKYIEIVNKYIPK